MTVDGTISYTTSELYITYKDIITRYDYNLGSCTCEKNYSHINKYTKINRNTINSHMGDSNELFSARGCVDF